MSDKTIYGKGLQWLGFKESSIGNIANLPPKSELDSGSHSLCSVFREQAGVSFTFYIFSFLPRGWHRSCGLICVLRG